jgi:phosphoglycerate dehydrogenase-like enzyme
MNNFVALEPKQFPAYLEAIESAGAKVVPVGPEVRALVWTDYANPQGLADTLKANPQLQWVQLPFAGVDAFSEIIQLDPVFTSAKRSYSEPVAEHALMLCMALGRILPERIRATSWGKKHADSLFDAEVLLVGGGGISEQLAEFLVPFRSKVTVVRKRPEQPFGSDFTGKVVGFEGLDAELPKAQFVVLACALTEETRFLFNSERFGLMRQDSYLVNIARGEVVDQEALLQALSSGQIAGAATDVTYPEPLPEGHPMWSEPRLIITPHTADTLPQVTRLFSERLRVNVGAWLSGGALTGVVDKALGY